MGQTPLSQLGCHHGRAPLRLGGDQHRHPSRHRCGDVEVAKREAMGCKRSTLCRPRVGRKATDWRLSEVVRLQARRPVPAARPLGPTASGRATHCLGISSRTMGVPWASFIRGWASCRCPTSQKISCEEAASWTTPCAQRWASSRSASTCRRHGSRMTWWPPGPWTGQRHLLAGAAVGEPAALELRRGATSARPRTTWCRSDLSSTRSQLVEAAAKETRRSVHMGRRRRWQRGGRSGSTNAQTSPP